MDSHHYMLKVSRLFPSSLTSCQFRTLTDVAESSISITKTNKILHENDLSSLSNTPPNPKKIPKNSSAIPKPCRRNHSSDACGRKCPPATPFSAMNSKKMEKFHQEKSGVVSSSNSGWFTSSDEKTRRDDDVETDAFLSLSSNSGDSFRLKTSRRFRRREEMKSIDETGRCSFSSVASFDTVVSKCSRKTAASGGGGGKTIARGGKKSGRTRPDRELGSDHISTQLYYHKNSDKGASFRRRNTSKNRRKIKKSASGRSFDYSSMIGESYAVEKSSSDPHGDFRASMVEMIVEKQIFAPQDLERLLRCFLSLNAVSYHGIIVDVFSEICQTLFCN